MKRISTFLFSGMLMILSGFGQSGTQPTNTLLWKISGNGLEKPSYLFGTIHMLCKDDALLSDALKKIIREVDEVYFEVDLDNMMEMLGAMSKMTMRGDTTLSDLLSQEEYQKVKTFFESKSSILPFSVLEKYKPILAASVLQQDGFPCETTAMMEQVIMQEAKKSNKKIKGLETMSYQAGILDEIPYKLQAEQLLAHITTVESGETESSETTALLDAYNSQDLKKMEELMLKSEVGMEAYSEILLFRRNRNWIEKMKQILPGQTLLIAVGAGHLPGSEGVIELLRKAGYTMTPVENNKSQQTTI